VKLQPVSSLVGLIAWQLSASKEARMDQPTQELQLGRGREPRLPLGRRVLALGRGQRVSVFDLVCRKTDDR
jgi:hypothetical protein